MPSSEWKHGLKLIGTPFSTFTRTVALGLHYKNIPFEQIPTTPKSELAFRYHPFGYLPTLSIELSDSEGEGAGQRERGGESSRVVNLSESQAIARFVERLVPNPPLELESRDIGIGASERTTSSKVGVLPEKVWEFASLVASLGFPILEHGLIKPEVALIDQGLPPTTFPSTFSLDAQDQARNPAISAALDFLSKIEGLMQPDTLFTFADHPTWADFYLYPILADLRATSSNVIISGKLKEWMKQMEALEAVKKTEGGTLSAGARP